MNVKWCIMAARLRMQRAYFTDASFCALEDVISGVVSDVAISERCAPPLMAPGLQFKYDAA